MKRLLAGVVLGAALFASSANAATVHTLVLTGDMSNFTTDSFTFDGKLYETGVLALTGFTPFVLQDGDTIETTVSVTGGPFSLPIRDDMFFGLNFSDLLGGLQPAADTTGELSFDGGSPINAGCSGCTSQIYGFNSAVLSFSNLTGSATFALGGDYAINSISISYQVNDAAVPEPGAWALMILGFGGAGVMLRHRRQTDTFAAA